MIRSGVVIEAAFIVCTEVHRSSPGVAQVRPPGLRPHRLLRVRASLCGVTKYKDK